MCLNSKSTNGDWTSRSRREERSTFKYTPTCIWVNEFKLETCKRSTLKRICLLKYCFKSRRSDEYKSNGF